MEYLPYVKKLSLNTIKAYRDCYRILIPIVASDIPCNYDEIKVEDITPDRVIRILSDIETVRNCSIQTRNNRLAAIKSLAQYVSMKSPEYLEWSRLIHNIPTKKHRKTLITYLERDEMNSLLSAPNDKIRQGYRNKAILLFMYNTGTRATEVVNVCVKDLEINRQGVSFVKILGKGDKYRFCPLWNETVAMLQVIIEGKNENDYVFENRRGEPMTRFGIYEMIKKYAKDIETIHPQIKNKRLTPHTIRHTTATHLLQSGVDINTIRAWLGHVSINTTNIYTEVNMEVKAKALEICKPNISVLKKKCGHFKENKDLMEFLNSL